MTRSMEKALNLHARLAEAFIETAAAIPDHRWLQPLAAEKWSPAEIAAHLVTTYDLVTGELRGGAGMAIRTNFLQQILLRLIFGWRILYMGVFPKGIKAPRETRPPAPLPKDEALSSLRSRREAFDAAARNASPGQTLSHAYFGRASVDKGVLLVARHIEHHRRQLL
jgi:hypothetical protein